jgi:hypothetical protein
MASPDMMYGVPGYDERRLEARPVGSYKKMKADDLPTGAFQGLERTYSCQKNKGNP